MSESHNAERTVSAFRRITNSRWFPLAFGLVVLSVVLYLNNFAGHNRVAGPRAPFPKKHWETFSWPEVRLKIDMPADPAPFRETQAVLSSTVDAIGYAASSEYTTYTVAYADYPPELPLPDDEEELMEQASVWLGAHAIDDEATVEKIVYRGRRGLEVNRIARSQSGKRLRNRARWFLNGRRAVIVGATGNEDGFDESGTKEFLESLRFKPGVESP